MKSQANIEQVDILSVLTFLIYYSYQEEILEADVQHQYMYFVNLCNAD